MTDDRSTDDVERARQRIERLASRIQAGERASRSRAGALLTEFRGLIEELRSQRQLLLAEREAAQSERRMLQQIFDLLPDACLLTDEQGAIRSVNRTAAGLLGEPAELLVGRQIVDAVAESDRPQLASSVARAAAAGEPAECELRLRGGNGPVRASVVAATEGDRVVGLRWVFRSIRPEQRTSPPSQQLLLARAAREHAEAARQRDAFLAEASAILGASLEYEITVASVSRLAVPRIADSCIAYLIGEDEHVQRLGVAHVDPALETALRSLLEDRPFDRDSLTRPIARVLRTGEVELLPEVQSPDLDPLALGADGGGSAAAVCPRSLMIVPLKIHDRVLGALSFGWMEPGGYTPDDLWLARKLAERAALAIDNARLHREARQASDAKSQFIGAMTHEFRTPMTAILAYAEMMVAGIPEPIPDAPRRHAERIVHAAQHLGELIDQVLALARIEAGRDRPEIVSLDLAQLVREATDLIEPLARQRGLELRLDLPQPGPVIATDPHRVRQILFNLLGNAVKFTQRGEIRVVLHPIRDGRVVLEVRDTGMGIAREHLHRVWEPFWRPDSDDPERPRGSGLGLGIVQRLVQLLDGRITVRSEPGQGSVFTVELPAAGRPASDAQPA